MNKTTRRTGLGFSLVLFVAALLVSWLTQGTGVVRNDLARNISIPDDLTMPLQVKAAYNGRDMFFRYRWPAQPPSIYHDMIKFEGGKWVRYGNSVPGPQAQGIYEDRVSMMVDDGSVPEFARYGGYITIGDGMRFFTHEAKGDEVKAHPYLGGKRKQEEVRKYLPATRKDINDWRSVVPEDELAALRHGEGRTGQISPQRKPARALRRRSGVRRRNPPPMAVHPVCRCHADCRLRLRPRIT